MPVEAGAVPPPLLRNQMFYVGATFGVIVHAGSNMLRKIRIAHKPWEIPIAFLVSGYFFQWWDAVAQRTEEKNAAVRAQRMLVNEAFIPRPEPKPPPQF
ncbi:hypothetical protein T492DRAFT_1031953 [Pavlovales sp. CCMP2436]|nr:hypothetical protein T492DRAFT_1031953 [Pavlovales sp. CCMP2436]